MKKFTLLDGMALVVWLLPAAYLLFVYGSLPQTVPLHFNAAGTADRYGAKSEFLIGPCVLAVVSALVYLLLKFLPSIDPKKQVKYGTATFQKLALGMVIFFAALNIAIIFSTLHNGFKINKLIFPIMGLLFAFLGNMFQNIKPNYFAGFKTPWTLESEENWRATHRLASKIWFIGGIILTITTLFLPPKTDTVFFIGCILVMAFVPFIYSFMYFKKHQPNQNS